MRGTCFVIVKVIEHRFSVDHGFFLHLRSYYLFYPVANNEIEFKPVNECLHLLGYYGSCNTLGFFTPVVEDVENLLFINHQDFVSIRFHIPIEFERDESNMRTISAEVCSSGMYFRTWSFENLSNFVVFWQGFEFLLCGQSVSWCYSLYRAQMSWSTVKPMYCIMKRCKVPQLWLLNSFRINGKPRR